ncbi:YciI family protein [Sphingomonas sp.]|jgi:hypothetical protein|uniref:YciI family protein n=1 Tax=Sphingomonas sp. TaxID=28214 RepID=UPI002DF0AFAD|nr:YciI family protein [Sphingomonas sp.]
MKYMLLIYEDETQYADPAKLQAVIEKHQAFAGTIGDRMAGGAGLRETRAATTVRTRGGTQSLHDGPFAETKEQLGGFYIVDVPDLDAALEIARQVPLAGDGSIEVRPVLD